MIHFADELLVLRPAFSPTIHSCDGASNLLLNSVDRTSIEQLTAYKGGMWATAALHWAMVPASPHYWLGEHIEQYSRSLVYDPQDGTKARSSIRYQLEEGSRPTTGALRDAILPSPSGCIDIQPVLMNVK